MHQLHSFPLCPSLGRVANISIVDGTAWRTAPLYVHTSFTLRVTSLLPGLANDTVMQARLHGTTILAADVQPVPDPGGGQGLYRVSYTLRDPGEYRLQLRMLWLSGASATFTPIPRLVREFLRSSVYVDCVFFNESIAVANNHVWDPVYHRADQVRFPSCESGVSRVSLSPHSSTQWVCLQPRCTSASLPGRWVRVLPTGGCPPWACSGSPAAVAGLTDLFHFNEGYVRLYYT